MCNCTVYRSRLSGHVYIIRRKNIRFSVETGRVLARVFSLDGASQQVARAVLCCRLLHLCHYSLPSDTSANVECTTICEKICTCLIWPMMFRLPSVIFAHVLRAVHVVGNNGNSKVLPGWALRLRCNRHNWTTAQN